MTKKRSWLAAPDTPSPKIVARKHKKRGPQAAHSLVSCFYIYYINLEYVTWTWDWIYLTLRMCGLREIGVLWGLDKISGRTARLKAF
jgi:hypothetical protein